MMVLSNGVQVRRPNTRKPLRKPSTPTSTTSRLTNEANVCKELVQGFKSRILLLDEDNFNTTGEVVKKEILFSLNKHVLTNSACLQLFLDTAWKDRNRIPIIAKMFHDITQDYDDESTTGLTALLEKTCNNLLNILTLLGKPEENDLTIVTLLSNLYQLKDLPEEHKEGVESYLVDIAKAFWPYFVPQKREVWDNELVADAICDVFHTVGQILENKCPVNMERTFNKITAMLFSMNTISEYTRLRLLEVKESRAADWSLPDSAKDYYKSAFLKHSRRSCDTPPRSVSLSSLSTIDNDVFDSSSAENSPPTTPLTTKTEFLINTKYEVSISKNCTTVSKKKNFPLVVHIKEKPQVKQNNNIETPVTSESTASMKELNPSSKLCSDDESCQTIFKEESLDNFESSGISTPKERVLQNQMKGSMTKCGGFGSPNLPNISTSSTSLHQENMSHNTGVFSRNSSIFSRGFSCPETNIPPSFSESPFNRHDTLSSNSSGSRHRLSSEGEMRTFNRNGGLHRSQSESSNVEVNYFSRRGQSSPGCDSTGFGNGNGGRFNSWRPNFQRQSSLERFKTNLEFPVKNIHEEEDLNPSSRLYLLSFALTAAALERPLDLTLTPEIESEKEWLKCLILKEPITVKDRFG